MRNTLEKLLFAESLKIVFDFYIYLCTIIFTNRINDDSQVEDQRTNDHHFVEVEERLIHSLMHIFSNSVTDNYSRASL